MRILFTGGGTGGHFFPILAVIRELKRIAAEELILDLELFYAGPDEFGKELLREEEVAVIPGISGKMRRYFSLLNVVDFLKIPLGILQAIVRMFLLMPDVVFSKGGYGALPTVIAAAIFRIPLIIHESDAAPGKVNMFSRRFAAKIGIAFTEAADFFPEEKTAKVGVPVRKRILGATRGSARENLGLISSLPAVGFLGASQGAQKLNDAVLGVLKELTSEFEILHQTGADNLEDVKDEASVILRGFHPERYHLFGFLKENDMRDFYAASDLVLSRAGASSIFEIAAWGKPSILLPLGNAAQDHQRKNAYEYAGAGACIIIEEDNLTPHLLFAEVKKALDDTSLMRKMGEAAQRFSRIDSAEVIAREILSLALHIKSGTQMK